LRELVEIDRQWNAGDHHRISQRRRRTHTERTKSSEQRPRT